MRRFLFLLMTCPTAACASAPECPPVSPVIVPVVLPEAEALTSAEQELRIKLIDGVVDDWHDAAAKADETRYFAHFTDDGVFLGTDATERWDVPAFRKYAHPHFAKGKAWAVDLSLWPRHEKYTHLSDLVKLDRAPQLSARATAGFYSRTQKASLNFVDEFITDIAEHAALMAEERAVA